MKLFKFREPETILKYPYKSFKVTNHFAFLPTIAYKYLVDNTGHTRKTKLYVFWLEKYIKEYQQENQYTNVLWVLRTVYPKTEFVMEKLVN